MKQDKDGAVQKKAYKIIASICKVCVSSLSRISAASASPGISMCIDMARLCLQVEVVRPADNLAMLEFHSRPVKDWHILERLFKAAQCQCNYCRLDGTESIRRE